jgi:phosphoribosyl-AMP cyclohydrolase
MTEEMRKKGEIHSCSKLSFPSRILNLASCISYQLPTASNSCPVGSPPLAFKIISRYKLARWRQIMKTLEEGSKLKLDFNKIARVAKCGGIVPVAVQNADTGELILLAYTNRKAFQKAMKTRRLVLWSTSRNELWEKGKTSGETFALVEVRVNCEQNSLLYKVRPRRNGICHTKNRRGKPRNCYYRRLNLKTMKLQNLDP